MPPIRMHGDRRKAKNPGKTMLRLLSYIKRYIPMMILVLCCIFLNTCAQASGSAALGRLVDDDLLLMLSVEVLVVAGFLPFGIDIFGFQIIMDGIYHGRYLFETCFSRPDLCQQGLVFLYGCLYSASV